MKYVISTEDIGQRIDVFLSGEVADLSRSRIKNLIETNKITVGGVAVKSNYRLRQGDVIDVIIPEPLAIDVLPEDIALDIIYEDEEVIVVNKVRGMVVHPAPGHYSGTLVNALMHHCGKTLSGINGHLRPGIVHRIDKDTSGVLVVAKTNVSHRVLSDQLAEHSMLRKYNAIVYNNIKTEAGTIDKPIGRHKIDRKKMTVTEGGRRAVTHYKVLERYGKYTHIEASLETGRTHQIRVHMAHIGHPLVGDTVYGSSKQPMNLNGQILHASILGFIHPVTDEKMVFEAPLPDYFCKVKEVFSR